MRDRAPRLRGRRDERETLMATVRAARAGQSSVLVVRGGSGIGKSALLDDIAERATGCRIVRAAGAESEMELAFAGLHLLCGPLLGGLVALPPPQRDALRVAFGLATGDVPDRLMIGLAVLGLLAATADAEPLVCLVDDAQWLDRSSLQVLGVVGRRLHAESLALLFAVREPTLEPVLTDLPEVRVGALDEADARALLAETVRGRLDGPVRDRILGEARGNPLALVELGRVMTSAEVAGGFGLPAVRPVATTIEAAFGERVRRLPPEAQRLLLLAAAEPLGDPTLLWRAADELGIDPGAAVSVVAEGLVDFGLRVRFRHPLVRSAVYGAATADERREVHRALAEATDAVLDPDRRAWHRAHAAAAPDDEVADELVRSAERARDRGGVTAAAAFLARAVELTADPARRGVRAIEAAAATLESAAPAAAAELLATAELWPLDEWHRARLELLRAEVEFARSRGNDAPALLLAAAARLEPLDLALARETYLRGLGAAMFAGRLNAGVGVREAGEVARSAPPARGRLRPADLLLDGLAMRFTEGYAAGVPKLRAAMQAFHDEPVRKEDVAWLWLACRVAADLWDDESWRRLAARQLRLARDADALSVLPIACTYRAGVHVHAGEFDEAGDLIEEAQAISAATGAAPFAYSALIHAAWRGDETRARSQIELALADAVSRGEGRGVSWASYVAAVLENGLGRYEEALVQSRLACEYDDLSIVAWALAEVVEAAVRSGRTEIASEALVELAERTRPAGTDWALGVEARSRALMCDGPDADVLYREAIERLGRTRIAVHLARAHLVYGEWLRRGRRRREGRDQLRCAHEMFVRFGAHGFAERAGRELRATGENVHRNIVDVPELLTSQEAQIARLARDGATNAQIGARLFISIRTVEWHLGHVFSKLAIASRKELHEALEGLPATDWR
jgi:DNA-binding CsgD family transcriptional regulator